MPRVAPYHNGDTHGRIGKIAPPALLQYLFCTARGPRGMKVDRCLLVYFSFARGLCSAKLSVQVGGILLLGDECACFYAAPHRRLLYYFDCVMAVVDVFVPECPPHSLL